MLDFFSKKQKADAAKKANSYIIKQFIEAEKIRLLAVSQEHLLALKSVESIEQRYVHIEKNIERLRNKL